MQNGSEFPELVAQIFRNPQTEVYIKENGKWKLAQLTFSHLLRPVKMNNNK
jgi:hypothetical protein